MDFHYTRLYYNSEDSQSSDYAYISPIRPWLGHRIPGYAMTKDVFKSKTKHHNAKCIKYFIFTFPIGVILVRFNFNLNHLRSTAAVIATLNGGVYVERISTTNKKQHGEFAWWPGSWWMMCVLLAAKASEESVRRYQCNYLPRHWVRVTDLGWHLKHV